MPQEFQVLQCYSCKTFQVHQVKKALKWACKLCGEKQSVIKVYGRGTGAECRQHVQRLNTMRGELDEAKCQTDTVNETSSGRDDWVHKDTTTHTRLEQGPPRKWDQFIEEDLALTQEDEETSGDPDIVYTTDASLFTKSDNRKRKSYFKAAYTSKRAKGAENSNIQYEESQSSQSKLSTCVDIYHTSSFETQDSFRENQSSSFVHNEFVPCQRANKTVKHHASLSVSSENTNSKWGAYLTHQLHSESQAEEEKSDDSQYQITDSYNSRMNQPLCGEIYTPRSEQLDVYTANRQEKDQNTGKYTMNLERDNRDLERAKRNNVIRNEEIKKAGSVNNNSNLEGAKRNNVVSTFRNKVNKESESVNASKWNKFLSFENEDQYAEGDEQGQHQGSSIKCNSKTVANNDSTTNSTPALVNTTKLSVNQNSLFKEHSDSLKDTSVQKNLKNQADSQRLGYMSEHEPSFTQYNKNNAILKSLYTLDHLSDKDLDF